METPLSTFLPFPRLPPELRLEIWRLALARTIELTWNNSKYQWEFDAKVPSVLQAVYEARAAFFDADALRSLKYGMKDEDEDLVDDIRPFYYSKFDKLYVRRDFYIDNKTDLSKFLRALQMDWEMQPYWWLGSQQRGPTLLRQFPYLETFTLMIRTSKTTHKNQDMVVVKTAKAYITRVIEIERGQYPGWRVPKIEFNLKKDQIDWNAYSIGESPD